MSTSVYEAWVRGLRSWQRDPRTDLSALPHLDESSFPPATYQRLINHLNVAINAHMNGWQDQLVAALGAATTDHDRARALVDARMGLAHRMALARHPAFPDQIRRELVSQVERDVRRLQDQLEDEANHAAGASSASSRPQREATLKLIRDNPLTAALDPSFEPATPNTVVGAAEPAGVADATGLVPAFTRDRTRRRIFDPDAQE